MAQLDDEQRARIRQTLEDFREGLLDSTEDALEHIERAIAGEDG